MPWIVEPNTSGMDQAIERLRRGGIVAFPTETVYGLGAATFDPAAVAAVYAVKGRASDNPLSAHVLDAAMARRVAANLDARFDELVRRFWPGPLTVVVARADEVPEASTAGRPTIALRCPRHEAARRLLQRLGAPISATSANRAGGLSPTAAAHVDAAFPHADDLLVLDGGPCEIGLESTVLDLTQARPRILRSGAVTAGQLRHVLGDVEEGEARSPVSAHGSLRTPAELIDSALLPARLRELSQAAVVLCFDAADVPPPHRAIVMPQGAGDYAKRMYDALREADTMGAARLVIQLPPTTNDLWRAIGRRLRRAVHA